MAVKIGEFQTVLGSDIKKADDLRPVFRLNWGAEVTSKIDFHVSENLKKGDKIKITIEKI